METNESSNTPSPISLAKSLSDIQANILKPHGRNHVWCLFIRFNLLAEENKVRKWISNFANELTSANDQKNWSIEKKKKEEEKKQDYSKNYDVGPVTSLYLSAQAYSKLNIKEPEEGTNSKIPSDTSFWNGMFSTKDKANLYDTKNISFQGNYLSEIHALIIIADNTIEYLNARQNEINAKLKSAGVGKIQFTEIGSALRFKGKWREHFGYQDGISKPKLLNKNNDPDVKVCMDNVFDLSLGSYLVFMKLEQNVKAFNEKINNLTDQLGVGSEYVGAQVVGRTKEGIPITMLDEKGNISSIAGDSSLSKCPFHAHARRARIGKPKSINNSIVRRGIPYGYRQDDLKDEPESGVGLLFMCFQKSIKNQFEVIQNSFNDSEGYGLDPFMGRAKKDDPIIKHIWSKERGTMKLDFFNDIAPKNKRVVKIKGGKYFYAPTIKTLKAFYQPAKEEVNDKTRGLVPAFRKFQAGPQITIPFEKRNGVIKLLAVLKTKNVEV